MKLFILKKHLILLALILTSSIIYSQENYEIQVYSSPSQPKNSTIFESHTNFTFDGEKNSVNGVFPSQHSLHETLEITTGITNNFEMGIYLFTNNTSSNGFQIVGTHIRPRITAPLSWKLPFGLSMSAEVGYQKPAYSEDTWNVELRPIIDKQWDKFYVTFNPAFGISLKGISNNHTPTFEPNVKMTYQFFKTTSFGVEYYGSLGNINNFESINNQKHALYIVYDLTGNSKWEVNIGTGFGLTQATDKWVGKLILGRKIDWK